MLPETRDTLLYRQLQEGLKYSLMEAPAVSGVTSNQSLCVAAKREERRQAELKKCTQCKPDYQYQFRSYQKTMGQAERS